MATNKNSIPIDNMRFTGGLYARSEPTFLFQQSQLQLLAEKLFDYLQEPAVFLIARKIRSFSGSAFATTLSLLIVKSEYNSLFGLPPATIGNIVSFVFTSSIIAFIASSCWIGKLESKHGKPKTRDHAGSWTITEAHRMMSSRIETTHSPSKGLHLANDQKTSAPSTRHR